jgi:voltage-gated potassium channel
VVYKCRHELVITGFFAFLLLMISSILMFEIEHDAQPDKFPNIFSAFWWAIATLTTIGYGDVYPVTDAGRALSAVIALIGIGFIALPTGIVSSGFIEEFRSRNEKPSTEEKYIYCPHCGKKIEH